MNSYEKTKDELMKRLHDKLEIRDESIFNPRLITLNTFQESGIAQYGFTAIAFALINYLATLGNGTLISILGSIIPTSLIPIALGAGAIGVGKLLMTLREKLLNDKAEMKKISKAKTEKEMQEEITHYHIKRQITEEEIEILRDVIKKLQENHKNLDEIDRIYNKDNLNTPQSYKDTKDKVNDLENKINNNYYKLRLISIKNSLHKQFYTRRKTLNHISDGLRSFIQGYLITFFTVLSPVILQMNNFIPISELISSIYTILAIGLPIIGGISFYHLITGIPLKIFKEINSQPVYTTYLPKKAEVDELEKINVNREEIINEITNQEIELQEQKRILDIFESIDTTDVSKSQDKSYIPLMENTYNEEEVIDKGNQYVKTIK